MSMDLTEAQIDEIERLEYEFMENLFKATDRALEQFHNSENLRDLPVDTLQQLCVVTMKNKAEFVFEQSLLNRLGR